MMVEAMEKEIRLRQPYLQKEPLNTIYFGGGTPSLLEAEELNTLLQATRETYWVNTEAEITLEANPDDITEDRLLVWKEAGINRLSIGIQSFQEEDLRWMNRAHSAQQSTAALELSQQYFDNITIDLIYGLPGLSDAQWKENVDRVLALGIPHLSCYALTVEPQTPLDKQVRLQQKSPTDPDKQAAQFLLLMEWLEQAGYRHYEISNFAKPGKESRHNSSYWQGDSYIGIGPSAHSYNGVSRQWNVANNQQYIKSLEKGKIPFEIETLTNIQQLNEYIMTALRTDEGIALARIDHFDLGNTSVTPRTMLLEKASKFLNSGLAIHKDENILLTREGKLLADGIAADLFF
jgi:oxygen-independent coproporphyrinogen-3 oxidase